MGVFLRGHCRAIGELLKALPKDVGGRPEKTLLTGEKSFMSRSEIPNAGKLKLEIAKELGFDHNQVHRFKTLVN